MRSPTLYGKEDGKLKINIVEELKHTCLPLEKLKNKKILVTGANGLIASNLVETLLYLNNDMDFSMDIYALCRNEEKAKKRFDNFMDNNSFHLIIQDVIEPLTCKVKFDYIYHAASSAHPGAFNMTPVDVMKANFIGTINLLEYCKGQNTRFVYVSSSEIYGENFENVQFFEESMNGSVNPTVFRSCYPESKRASETLCECYKKQYGSDVIIVRPAFIYGREIIDSNVRADVYFLRQVLNHKDIVLYSEGSQIRSYCYINDCISAMLFATLKGESGEVYNIGNDECVVTLHDYAQILADAGGVKLIYEPKSRPDEVTCLQTTRCVLKADKLKKLGWKANYQLEDGVRDILDCN